MLCDQRVRYGLPHSEKLSAIGFPVSIGCPEDMLSGRTEAFSDMPISPSAMNAKGKLRGMDLLNL